MKFKLLASSAILAGALMASGSASALVVWSWSGTVQNWITSGTIIDNTSVPLAGVVNIPSLDPTGNMSFTFGSFGGVYTDLNALNTNVTLQEVLTGGVTLLNVAFTSPGSIITDGETLKYTETAIGTNLITSASLDATVASNDPKILANIPLAGLNLLYQNKQADPLTGEYYFSGVPSVTVTNTYNALGSSISSVANQININNSNVPEPYFMSLLGLGLAAFGFSRRRSLLGSEGQSA
jgi:hypothetical protein